MPEAISPNELLARVKKIVNIACFSIRQRIDNPRIICLFVLLTIYIWNNMLAVNDVANSLDMRVNLLIFPFFSSHVIKQLVLYACIVFLFSDAPFINETQPYVIIRSRRTTWALGQILHIILFSGMFFAALMLVSVLVLLPNGSLLTDGWGQVVNTLHYTNIGEQFGLSFSLYGNVLNRYTPFEAFVFCFLLNWCMTSFIGVLIFAVNLIANQVVGPIIAGAVVLLDILVFNSFDGMEYISPLSLSRLSNLDRSGIGKEPSITYAFCFFLTAIAILSAISVILSKKRSMEIMPEL